jgi:hypothetical protein
MWPGSERIDSGETVAEKGDKLKLN